MNWTASFRGTRLTFGELALSRCEEGAFEARHLADVARIGGLAEVSTVRELRDLAKYVRRRGKLPSAQDRAGTRFRLADRHLIPRRVPEAARCGLPGTLRDLDFLPTGRNPPVALRQT